MAKKLTIKLDTSRYKAPTQEDLQAAKTYILRMNDAANAMRDYAVEEIEDAAVELAQIAMRYEIDPKQFSFDSSVSEDMMTEVAAVMDNLEDSLVEHLEDYATACAEDEGSKTVLLAFLLTLGHRNLGIRDTVHEYLWRTLRQTEALVVAAKENALSPTQTLSVIRSALASVNTDRFFLSLMRYRHLYNAQFIRSGGKATYSDGTPNVQGVPVAGVKAVVNTLVNAVHSTWHYNETEEMRQNGAAGYWQFRGSDFPCDICDEEVGFHELGDMEYDEWPHAHCMCGRIPIYRKEELENMTEYGT